MRLRWKAEAKGEAKTGGAPHANAEPSALRLELESLAGRRRASGPSKNEPGDHGDRGRPTHAAILDIPSSSFASAVESDSGAT